MAATTNWYEQNGPATGSPAHGVESAISACDWKSADDTTTPRASAPVLAGENSYENCCEVCPYSWDTWNWD